MYEREEGFKMIYNLLGLFQEVLCGWPFKKK